MNVNKLKGKIVEKGINVAILSDIIGVDCSTLYRKLNASEKITIGEAKKIKDVLELRNEGAYDIFLA